MSHSWEEGFRVSKGDDYPEKITVLQNETRQMYEVKYTKFLKVFPLEGLETKVFRFAESRSNPSLEKRI